MDNNHIEVKVFGDKAKRITDGTNFIATVGSVEGRTVVTLKEVDGYYRCLDCNDQFSPDEFVQHHDAGQCPARIYEDHTGGSKQ